MLTPEQETEIRRKSEAGLCHFAGCNNQGKRTVQLTFATIAPFDPPVAGRNRVVQALINGWECNEHR